jgi:hypothetical protein
MIDRATRQQLQQFIQAKQLEWSQIAFGRRWDVESLANELASDARFAQVQLCGFWYGPTETEIRNILSPILAFAGYGPDLAVVSAAVALACHKRRVQAAQRLLAAMILTGSAVGAWRKWGSR